METAKSKKAKVTGALGWPCPGGNAVQLQAQTSSGLLLNCLVFFYVEVGRTPSPGLLLEGFAGGLATIKAAEAHSRLRNPSSLAPLDLNLLAADFQKAIRGHFAHHNQCSCIFKAVAVVPAYGTSHSVLGHGVLDNWLGDFAGIAAKGGHFIVNHLHVPMKLGFDLNSPPDPLLLYFFVAMPTALGLNSELPACRLCE